MIIDSNSNPYKKLLKEQNQFFDFPSDDESFKKSYSDYQKNIPSLEKEKYLNSRYPDFEENGGIVYFLSEAIILFNDLLEEKKEELVDYSFEELENSFHYNMLERNQLNELEDNIFKYLKNKFSNLRLKYMNEVIYDFINDYDISNDIKLVLEASTNDLFLTSLSTQEYEVSVDLTDKDEVEIDGYSFSLSALKEYLEEDEELMSFILDITQNLHLQNTYFSYGFLNDITNYVKKNRPINGYTIMGGEEYPVVINEENLNTSFTDFIDNQEDLEYIGVKSLDNTVWEEEE